MSAELRHVVNGWLSSIRGRESAPSARDVAVPTTLGLRRSLYTATTSLSSATVKSLQKKLRDAGFKGAVVEPLLRSDGGGFTVQYDGQEYKFWIDEAKMRSNGRGLYHGTGVSKNDMVLHQDHRGRWRIDLVTSAGGNHTDVTGRESGAGPNQGYSTAELAFAAALDEQRRRGLRGKTHVWIQRGDGYESYEPEGDYLPNADWGASGEGEGDYVIHEGALYLVTRGGKWQPLERRRDSLSDREATDRAAADARERGTHDAIVFVSRSDGLHQIGNVTNGRYRAGGMTDNSRRTGILSDGTRVNVYLDESTPTDAWTVVPHSMEWDSMARGEMREMLGISRHGSGSQWTQGQEGRHLGRKVAWDEVPGEVKRHIERRLVSEASMSANPRGSTVDEHAKRELELYIENEYSLVGAESSIGKSIDTNLRRKVASGKYDPTLAPKAWQYLIDEGAKRYAKEFGTGDHAQIFSAATRRAVAAEFARAWEVENKIPVTRLHGEGATEFEARSQARQRGLR